MLEARDPASDQLKKFKERADNHAALTTSSGSPVANKTDVITMGPRGPMVLQDMVFLDEITHFDRERIPERVVHAKGAGAFGYFEVTHDISRYSKAVIFQHIGKQTPLFIRFSTVAGESASADTARDPRGFAIKFYTEIGNFDLVGNNTPIFFIRDPLFFPTFIHTQKRNPVTHLKDADMFWDFITLRPECIHQTMFLFSDRGTPDGYRHMNGYGSHTYKLVNAAGEAVYCKYHIKTNQGIRNLLAPEAKRLGGDDPDYAIRDLYNSIERGEFPSWTFYLQVMTFKQAEEFQWNPFDLTKIWPHKQFPLIPVGKIVLNRNPANYFAEVEQSAFSPAHFIPGIEPSPDKMLQGRLLAYADTHFHRLGPNYLQLPINCPYRSKVANYQRDGGQTINHQGGAPNYYPNSFNGPKDKIALAEEHKFSCAGDVQRYNSADDDNFSQPRMFWTKVLKEDERQRLVENTAKHLAGAQHFIREKAVLNFSKVDPEFGKRLADVLSKVF